MSENLKLVLFLIIAVCLFFVIGQTWRQVRSFRLNRLSKKYNLNYCKNFRLFYHSEKKFNIISGNINNKIIEIYDTVTRSSYNVTGSGISSYRTIIQFNNNQIESKVNTFASTGYIESEIKKHL